MTRKASKSRKHYPANPWAYQIALTGSLGLDTDDQLIFGMRARSAAEALIASHGTASDWGHVIDALNVSRQMQRMRKINLSAKVLTDIKALVVAAIDRQHETHSNVLRPVEVVALRQLCGHYGRALAVVNCREFFDACERVSSQTAQALHAPDANRSIPGVRLLDPIERRLAAADQGGPPPSRVLLRTSSHGCETIAKTR